MSAPGYTTALRSGTFDNLQLNAGILLKNCDYSSIANAGALKTAITAAIGNTTGALGTIIGATALGYFSCMASSVSLKRVLSLSRPLMTAQNATGNVRNYQVVVGGIVLLNLPLSFVCLKLGADASVVVVIALVIELVALFTRVFMIPFTIKEFNAFAFVRKVILRCVCVSVVSCIMPFIMVVCLKESAMMFFLNVLVCLLCTSLTVFYLGCERSERTFLLNKASQMLRKVIK